MKTVITYGTFDLFHEGHYNLLKRAKELGDYLIVGVTSDHFDETRGKVNIVDSVIERMEHVKKTGLADKIIVEDHEGQKIEDIQKYGVDIFTVGSDWEGHFDYLHGFCEVCYLPRTPNISSTMLRGVKTKLVRIGIVGTGRIAPRFLVESKYVGGVVVEYAYNPVAESGRRFEREHGIACITENLQDFFGKVDAVYIASPNETHYTYARQAILAEKHVLCEKPLAFTRKESEELYELARKHGVILMEGVKTAYCPGFWQLLEIARSGKIGEIRDVEACFSRLVSPDTREMTDVKYGGAFLEFGSYPLLPIIKLLGKDYEKVEIQSILDDNGIDHYTKVQIYYKNAMATAKMGIGVKSEGQLIVAGTKGYLLAKSPWWLTKSFEIRYEDPNKIEHFETNFQGDGLRYEIGEFVLKINGMGGHDFKLTAGESVAMAGIVEQFMREKAGVSDEMA